MLDIRSWLDRTTETWAPPTADDASGPYRLLWWLARSQMRRVTLGAAFGICWMVGLAVPPWVLSRAIDQGLVAGNMTALLGWAAVLLASGVLIALLAIARHRTMTKVRMDASFRLVRTTTWQSCRLGASLSQRMSDGEVVTIGIADVYTVARALTVTGPGVGAVIAYAVVVMILFTISPLLAIIVLAGVPLVAIVVAPSLRRIERTGHEYRHLQGQLTTRLVDVLAGLRVLNGLGGKALVADRYTRQSQELVTRGYRVAGPTSSVGALAAGLPALFLAAVVWLSARLAVGGDITIGDMVAVYGYVAMLVVPVASFIEGGADIARAQVAGRRIIALLNLPIASDHGTDRPSTPFGDGPLTDPDSGVTIRPGLLTTLVAAKSADAVGVIERLRQSPQVPRWQLVVADHDAEIFSGSVRDIVAGRLDPHDDKIRKAIFNAVADDVVEALPGGLDALIAAGGRDLSGGQRQRIRLARALYLEPDVLLAIEPTSAVDANTEALIVERLRLARSDKTTVITTTSPLVLDRADEVIFLVDGRLASVGPHDELLRTDHRYRDLVSREQDEVIG